MCSTTATSRYRMLKWEWEGRVLMHCSLRSEWVGVGGCVLSHSFGFFKATSIYYTIVTHFPSFLFTMPPASSWRGKEMCVVSLQRLPSGSSTVLLKWMQRQSGGRPSQSCLTNVLLVPLPASCSRQPAQTTQAANSSSNHYAQSGDCLYPWAPGTFHITDHLRLHKVQQTTL